MFLRFRKIAARFLFINLTFGENNLLQRILFMRVSRLGIKVAIDDVSNTPNGVEALQNLHVNV